MAEIRDNNTVGQEKEKEKKNRGRISTYRVDIAEKGKKNFRFAWNLDEYINYIWVLIITSGTKGIIFPVYWLDETVYNVFL